MGRKDDISIAFECNSLQMLGACQQCLCHCHAVPGQPFRSVFHNELPQLCRDAIYASFSHCDSSKVSKRGRQARMLRQHNCAKQNTAATGCRQGTQKGIKHSQHVLSMQDFLCFTSHEWELFLRPHSSSPRFSTRHVRTRDTTRHPKWS